jgi:hypothetical protein
VEEAFVSWRGTLLLLILAGLALCTLFLCQRSRTHSADEPLLRDDRAAAETITIVEGSSRSELFKQENIWKLKVPLADRANPEAVRSLLDKAYGMTVLDRLKHGELKGNANLDSLNLKHPGKIMTIRAAGMHTLSFGAEGPASGQVYVRADADRSVYLVSSETASLAFRPAAEFRDPRLTTLAPDYLKEIALRKNGSGGSQELRLKKDSGGWNIESPLAARCEKETVAAWAASLVGAKVVRWMPDGTDPAACGLDVPAAILTAREDGGNPVTIMIGSEVQGSPGSHYARCSDRPGICQLTGISSALEVTPEALRSRKMQAVSLDAVDGIEIRGYGVPGQLLLTRRKGSDDWEIRGGRSDVISGATVSEWYGKFVSLQCRGFEPATPEHLAQRGLVNTPLTLRLVAHLSENTAEESAGDIVLGEYAFGIPSDGMVGMRLGNSSDLMIFPDSALELAKGPVVERDSLKP